MAYSLKRTFVIKIIIKSVQKSHFNPENKTKIFQIGSDRLTIIDTDGPGVLDVKFSRVSRCVQGVKHKTCFGFVAREPKKSKVLSPNQEKDFSTFQQIKCILFSNFDLLFNLFNWSVNSPPKSFTTYVGTQFYKHLHIVNNKKRYL